jgi:hypothetical protein
MPIFFTRPARAPDPPGLILSAAQAAAQRSARGESRKR